MLRNFNKTFTKPAEDITLIMQHVGDMYALKMARRFRQQ